MSIPLIPEQDRWLNELREKIKVGLQELERGEGIELDIVIKQLRDKVQNASPH
jgi:antitoxin ParD1/3/4